MDYGDEVKEHIQALPGLNVKFNSGILTISTFDHLFTMNKQPGTQIKQVDKAPSIPYTDTQTYKRLDSTD